MARRATGTVIAPKGKQRSWAIRFTAYGRRHFVSLGRPEDDWDRQRAEAELRHVLADVERGIWRLHEPEPVAVPKEEPTFHEFASEWYERHRPEWRDGTAADYRWALSYHLLPYFAKRHLPEITPELVDRFKAEKLREQRIAPATINKTLVRLAQILAEAVEYGYLERNPAQGRKRRVKAPQPSRSWVEPEQLLALLEAADPWHRPILAVMAGAGLRVGEACALHWDDVNLATSTLVVRKSKTAAGTGRAVDLPGGLVDELTEWKARSPLTGPGDPMFVSRVRKGHHGRQTKDNVSRRLKGAIRRANESLAEMEIEPIGERVTPHSLRRTYASLRSALRDDPFYIAEALGHTNPAFTFRVYHKAAKRREKLSGAYLMAFDRALQWAEIGRIGELEEPEAANRVSGATSERA